VSPPQGHDWGQATDLEALAQFAAEVTTSSLPAEVLETVKACLLYGLAVGVATNRTATSRAACSLLDLDPLEQGSATRLLDGKPEGMARAALANAVLLSGRAQGDSHPAGHIGGVVIPVALSVAEHARATGAQFLAGLVSGYEAALRIGRDHAAVLTKRGFRTTPAYGVFGAAAVTARMLHLSPAAMRDALSLASNGAAGLREYVNAGTDESPFQAGLAAQTGISAALLAATGKAGRTAPTALSGEAGFFRAYGGEAPDRAPRLCEGLGQIFECTTVTYKPYPACQFLRGMIRALIELRSTVGDAKAREITVTLCPFEADFIGVRYGGPFTAASQTIMSAPFCAALAWCRGNVSFDGMRRFDDHEVLALVPNVRIVAEPALARYQTRLDVQLQDGRSLKLEDHAGDEEFRLGWRPAVKAAAMLCAEVDASADALVDAIENIEMLTDIGPVIRAVRSAIGSG
jgi:2-methylcitrate dehydratase PrpD